ncbi:MAG: dephospho-CoA kinase [Clostridiales bacterium]|nr:dephospho-CoA kinase [Clostridiales bacterium]
MKIIGITGGIGSGKTAVLNILHDEYGAFIMEADSLAHRLMEPGQQSYNDIVAHFGDEILGENKNIDRAKLSAIVFGDQDKLKLLNSITHPNVKKAILQSIEDQRTNGCKLYVLEAALLIQDGYLDICNEMWFVYADISRRIERLCNYRGFTEEKARKVINSQEPDSYYETNCVKKIDNSGDLKKLRDQLRSAMEIE